MKIFIAILLIASVAGSCTKPKDLEFVDISNLRMIKWGLTESLVGVEIRLYNPNNQRVQVKDPVAKIYANSAYLGETRMDSVVMVPRMDTFSIPLVLKVQTVTAISQLLEALSDSMVNVKVEGNVKMGKGGVFITYPIRYEQLQRVSDLKY